LRASSVQEASKRYAAHDGGTGGVACREDEGARWVVRACGVRAGGCSHGVGVCAESARGLLWTTERDEWCECARG